jgi:hypothetical protein
MSCCGKGRSQFQTHTHANPGSNAAPLPQPYVASTRETIHFEYLGATALTVRGPITGRNYRFNHQGEQVAVDRRDSASLMAVPKLRRVR